MNTRANSVKLKELLRLHDQSLSAKGIANVIGDPYLYAHNPIYKNLRNAFLAFGGKFQKNPPFPYFGHKVYGLVDLIEHNIVPYRDTVSRLRWLESQQPGSFTTVNLIPPMPMEVSHESAHCLAHRFLSKEGSDSVRPKSHSDRQELLRIILGESFASTAELIISCYDCHKRRPAAEQWFLQQTSYLPERFPKVGQMIEEIGIAQATQISLLLFVYSNFLCRRLNAKARLHILEFVKVDQTITRSKKFKENFMELENAAFLFDVNFRVTLTGSFLRSIGYTQSLTRLYNFDPLPLISNTPRFVDGINKMAAVLEGHGTSGRAP